MPILQLALCLSPQVPPPVPPPSAARQPGPTTHVRAGVAASSRGVVGPLTNGGFHNGLFAWETAVSPGSPAGTIAVVAGECELAENASFLTTLSQPLIIPADAERITFDLVATDFDLSGGVFPDAFEVSLLDGAFQSVVPSWAPGATSFFNVQEDGTQLSGAATSATAAPGLVAHVTLDVAALAPALSLRTDLALYFDLIGADTDSASRVRIDNVTVEGGAPGTSYCEGIACPCGNDAPGRGCANSGGVGGLLEALGSASIGAGDLTLQARDLPRNFAVFIVAAGETCTPLGDGIMAVQPGLFQTGILRASIQLVDPAGTVSLGPNAVQSIESALQMPGLVTAGSTWYFQVAYRDEPTSPCGSRFNLTNGVRITFVD